MSDYEQLSGQLYDLYGDTAQQVYKRYVKHDPLAVPGNNYWEHVRIFMDELHAILYDKDHKLSIMSIRPESYFILTNMCVGRSFTVADLISINSKDISYSNISYDIAYEVLPGYITYRRQTPKHTHHTHELGVVAPDRPTPQVATSVMQPMYPQMHPMYPQMYMHPQIYPQMHPHMYNPYMPYHYKPALPPHSHSYSLQQTQTPSPEVRPNRPGTPATDKLRPKIIVKPVCIRRGDPKVASSVYVISDEDNVPADFYSVYCSNGVVSTNDTSTEHHVPYILPVMNRPPPPVPSQ